MTMVGWEIGSEYIREGGGYAAYTHISTGMCGQGGEDSSSLERRGGGRAVINFPTALVLVGKL